MSETSKKFHTSAKELLPTVIRRGDIPAITHVMIGDVNQFIGEVRDFRRNSLLSDFIPNEGRSSLSWVHINADEIHQTHKHPTASMVIICEGAGELTGDTAQPVSAGDIVMIPPQALHGFSGGNKGFWGLSIQFEGSGLYEKANAPRMQLSDGADKFRPLEDAQKAHTEQYGRNQLVELVRTEEIRENKNLQNSLLDILQIWSDRFQKLIRIRSASSRDEHFAALADQHLKDEFDHNKILDDLRGNRPVHVWDAALESAAAWFAERMAKGSDVETAIIMHLVIEEAGDIFHKVGAEVFPNTQHFDFHGNHDEDHAAMGLQILKQHSTESIAHMVDTLNQGWAMMNLLCNRMAELAVARAHSPNATPEVPAAGRTQPATIQPQPGA